jgi:hypothetical protein
MITPAMELLRQQIRDAIHEDALEEFNKVCAEFEGLGVPVWSSEWALGGKENSWPLPTYAVDRNAFKCLDRLVEIAIAKFGESLIDGIFDDTPSETLVRGVRESIVILDRRIISSPHDGYFAARREALVNLLKRIHAFADQESWLLLGKALKQYATEAASRAVELAGSKSATTECGELTRTVETTRPDLVDIPPKKRDFRV